MSGSTVFILFKNCIYYLFIYDKLHLLRLLRNKTEANAKLKKGNLVKLKKECTCTITLSVRVRFTARGFLL